MRKRRIAGLVAVGVVGTVYVANASWLAPEPKGVPLVLAHRGVHQNYRREGFTDKNACTADRIYPPTNPYIENTIPSMEASFAAGASQIELDVHPTTDGEFAVFHDWTLECKTNGKGVTREQPMSYLRTLDLGYRYTADGGKTFPFRGKGVGMMKTLDEVLRHFPGKPVLINIKSADPWESEQLVAYLKRHGQPIDGRLRVWAAGKGYDRLRELAPQARVISRASAKSCAARYLLLGWMGYVPAACRGATLGVPANLRWLYWGWPNRLLDRMGKANVEVMLVGPLNGREPAINSPAQLAAIPDQFNGWIMTDHIETIGPAVRKRWAARPSR
ncbi:MAG: glycerophosphodiester phosphodiesterase family protein [Sphingomicrobium sp.]